jgi:hypothetical protein
MISTRRPFWAGRPAKGLRLCANDLYLIPFWPFLVRIRRRFLVGDIQSWVRAALWFGLPFGLCFLVIGLFSSSVVYFYDAWVRASKQKPVAPAGPTWRANRDWGEKLGHSHNALAAVNRECIALIDDIRHSHEDDATPIVISGNLGPRGDGYNRGLVMTPCERPIMRSLLPHLRLHLPVWRCAR